MTAVSFTVLGEPAGQGSKRHVGRGIMVEASAKTRPWRQAVAAEAALAMENSPTPIFEGKLLDGPVWVSVTFTFQRPQSHYRTGRHAGELKPNAPRWMSTGPDTDKLLRALGDALTGTVLRDDRQIAVWDAQKVYGDRPRAEVTVRTVDALERVVKHNSEYDDAKDEAAA